jgi:hypothetical protein
MPNRQKLYIVSQTQKKKILNTNAAMWFNKLCKNYQLTPKYISIKANGNNKQSQNTKNAAIKYRLKQELKFLYMKKQKLNEKLYNIHLENAED